jgi:hypothetical protein
MKLPHRSSMRKPVAPACLVVALLGLTASPAWPWGQQGHRVVAKVAAKNLSPAARQKLAAILQTGDAGLEAAMAAAATWPDEINKAATQTGDWHFVDVPISLPFSLIGLCSNHDCVVDQIVQMVTRLQMNMQGFKLKAPASPARPVSSEEAAFLIHFVGDIHQPLHAANNGDRGGNCVNLTTPISHPAPERPTTELHAVWDVDVVLAAFQDLGAPNDEDNAATKLFQRYKSAAPGDWEKATVQDWARESNDLAKKDIYQKLGIPNRTATAGQCAVGITPVTIDQPYLSGAAPDAEQQLMRAGIRLSDMLNQICSGSGCAVVSK